MKELNNIQIELEEALSREKALQTELNSVVASYEDNRKSQQQNIDNKSAFMINELKNKCSSLEQDLIQIDSQLQEKKNEVIHLQSENEELKSKTVFLRSVQRSPGKEMLFREGYATMDSIDELNKLKRDFNLNIQGIEGMEYSQMRVNQFISF
jgi:chromosome segregation ATPase